MFNLLITAGEGQWDGSPYALSRSRVFEYTSDELIERFSKLDSTALDELMSLPALFAYEHPVGEPARVGWISRIIERGHEVRVEYSIESGLPEIPAARLGELVWELDIGDWELNRTHWAVKNVDLFTVLVEAGLLTEGQVKALPKLRQWDFEISEPILPVPINPSVFRLPAGGQEVDLVAVMMPFQTAFEGIYKSLKIACSGLGLRCLNANEVWNENEIIQDVFSLIYRSKVVICDFSGRNPNVFYEAGIAHTLGRAVIPIVQNPEHIPFDLRHHRYIEYLNNDQGWELLRAQIIPRLRHLTR